MKLKLKKLWNILFMYDLTLTDILMGLFILTIFIGFIILFKILLSHVFSKKKLARDNRIACRKVINAHRKRLYTDYFWSNHMRFVWIIFFLLFFIALGIVLNTLISLVISFVLVFVTLWFLYFAINSYKNFPKKAAKRLEIFETQIKAAVEAEICFDADNIQTFSSSDEKFDTKPEVFSFPTNVTKITFPPYETRFKRQNVIATRKLEFLVLSREYFSICKGAGTFDLLNPKRAPEFRQCVEFPGRAGECREYYYSQIRNVLYNNEDESIHIIYYHDEDEDIIIPCKKRLPIRKPAMKALKGKLRLTERQKLHKIDEHEKYEEILERRDNEGKDTEEN